MTNAVEFKCFNCKREFITARAGPKVNGGSICRACLELQVCEPVMKICLDKIMELRDD